MLWIIPIMLAVILHEVAHGYAALKMGDTTARDMGRLTLNPIPHIDPVGTIIIPLALVLLHTGFIFGYARPVPVNFHRFKNQKRGMVLTAAAGPLTNLLLALAAAILLRLVYLIDPNLFLPLVDANPSASYGLGVTMLATALHILFYLVLLSVVLALFNLIPIPPLDGGRIVTGLLPDDASRSYAKIEPFGIFIVIGLLLFIPIFQKMLVLGIALVSMVLLGGDLLHVLGPLFPGG